MHTPGNPTPTAKRRPTRTHPGTISATQTCSAAIHGLAHAGTSQLRSDCALELKPTHFEHQCRACDCGCVTGRRVHQGPVLARGGLGQEELRAD